MSGAGRRRAAGRAPAPRRGARPSSAAWRGRARRRGRRPAASACSPSDEQPALEPVRPDVPVGQHDAPGGVVGDGIETVVARRERSRTPPPARPSPPAAWSDRADGDDDGVLDERVGEPGGAVDGSHGATAPRTAIDQPYVSAWSIASAQASACSAGGPTGSGDTVITSPCTVWATTVSPLNSQRLPSASTSSSNGPTAVPGDDLRGQLRGLPVSAVGGPRKRPTSSDEQDDQRRRRGRSPAASSTCRRRCRSPRPAVRATANSPSITTAGEHAAPPRRVDAEVAVLQAEPPGEQERRAPPPRRGRP